MHPLLRLFLYVGGSAAFFSVLCFVVPALRQPKARNIRLAIWSWWPPILTGFVGMAFGVWGILLVFSVVGLQTMREYFSILPTPPIAHTHTAQPEQSKNINEGMNVDVMQHVAQRWRQRAFYIAVATTYAPYAFLYAVTQFAPHALPQFFLSTDLDTNKQFHATYWLCFLGAIVCSTLLTLVWTFALVPFLSALRFDIDGTLKQIPMQQSGVLLTSLCLSPVVMITMMSPSGVFVHSGGLASLLLVCVMCNDAAQYVFGKILGKHLLVPTLSPKKTWEGFLGGMLFTSLIGMQASQLLTPWSTTTGFIVGMVLSILGLAGDLLVSAIKRDAGVKDMGTLLPGQGGLLDRCDSLLICAPLYALYALVDTLLHRF